jgi:antitoxin HigA-1
MAYAILRLDLPEKRDERLPRILLVGPSRVQQIQKDDGDAGRYAGLFGEDVREEVRGKGGTRTGPHPGEMLLKEFLEPLGVSQVEAARRMRVPFQRLNAIVKARRGVSADTALLFEALTGWDAQIWLTLQAKWDLWHALRARGQRPKVKALSRTA